MSKRKPDFEAFQIIQVGEGKPIWNKIGVAWEISGGAVNLQLNSIPLDGKIQLRVPQSKENEES